VIPGLMEHLYVRLVILHRFKILCGKTDKHLNAAENATHATANDSERSDCLGSDARWSRIGWQPAAMLVQLHGKTWICQFISDN